MGQAVVQFTDDQYEMIGNFVRSRFHQWLLEDVKVNGDAVTSQLNRIESSLEASIVLSRERFEMMDQRFERMDQRFEEQKELNREHFILIEKRF
ncbi:MAG: hypothetical protein KAH21_06445, partial [Spirochaetaceae bacterium]|nr:hypothetical protein [Spirochaetaceae bacterium]